MVKGRIVLEGGGVAGGVLERAVDGVVQAVNFAFSRKGDDLDFLGVARFEANSGACRDVEPKSTGSGSIEVEGAVALEEVKMATDLNRAIASIADNERFRFETLIRVQRRSVRLGYYFAGYHVTGLDCEPSLAWSHLERWLLLGLHESFRQCRA